MAVVPRTKAAAQNNLAAIAAIPPVFVIKNILAYRVIYPIRFRQVDAGMLNCLFHLVGDSGTSARQLLTSCLGNKTLEDSHAEGNAIGIKSSANRYNRRITAQVADFLD